MAEKNRTRPYRTSIPSKPSRELSEPLPVGSRVIMLPMLVIGPYDPHEDSVQLESVSILRLSGVTVLASATERLTVARSEQSHYVYGSLVLDSSLLDTRSTRMVTKSN